MNRRARGKGMLVGGGIFKVWVLRVFDGTGVVECCAIFQVNVMQFVCNCNG